MHVGFLATWAVVPALIAGVIIVLLTRRRASKPTLSRVESWTVGLIGTGALLVLLAGAASLYAATSVFSSNPTRVSGFAIANASSPSFAAKSDAVVDAGYESVWLSISDLPLSIRWLMYAEAALPALAMIAVCVGVFWLAMRLLSGRAFTRSLTQTVGVAAIVVMVAGVGSQIFASAARGSVVEYLDPQLITAGDNGSGAYEGLMGWMLNLDGAPIGWALALALVAAAFDLGQRVQKDTEGLV